MQKKLFFYYAYFLSFSSLFGMNTEQEALIQGPIAVTMEYKKDCRNCWGNEECFNGCEKTCMCLAAPCIGCLCCYLVISDKLLFDK